MTSTDERSVHLLEELVAWTRFTARDALVRVLKEVLVESKHLAAYEFTDGTRTQKEIGDASGLSQPTVSTLWQRWKRLGIVREAAVGVCHLAHPADLGLSAEDQVTPASKGSKRRAG